MRSANLFCTPTSTSISRRNRSVAPLWLATTLLLTAALLLPSIALGQGNYVYVNNQTASNSVNAYSVSATGALTQLPLSPFSTGGKGANVVCYGLNRTTVSGANNLLFIANTGDLTISVFQINPATGALTLAPGSPFASGLALDTCQGMSLAVTPDGSFLMASSNGSIQTFSVAANGALALVSTTPNCCTPIASMVISPNGKFLAVSNESSVSVFTITAGVLAPVAGSPFPKTGTGTVSGLDFSCAGDRLYGGEATGSPTIADAWTVDTTTGVLTPTPGSPFHTVGNDSNIVLLSPDNSLLFESNQFTNSVNSFSLQANGDLTSLGKFGGSTAVHLPVGMATDRSGTFLYIADDNFGVAVFRISSYGVLSPLSDLAINRPGEIQDLAAYPPRTCATADLALTMTASPNPVVAGTPITYTINITNNGPAAASAVISDTLPPTTTNATCAVTGAGNFCGLAKTPATPIAPAPVGASRVSGVTTITTTVPHLFIPGVTANVSGLADTTFNGSFVVASVPTPTTFTYNQAGKVNATTGTGVVSSLQVPVQTQVITFPSLASGETETATLTATTSTTTATGTVISDTATISNKSAVDPVPGNNAATVTVTVSKPSTTTLTVPTATGPYGGVAILSATLKTSANVPVPGKTVTFSLSPQNFPVYSGVTDANGVATVTAALGTITVGTHLSAFTATFAGDANFGASSSVGTLIVTKAQLTVTADNQSRLYGDANPPLTYTITGFVNGDTIAVVSGTASCSTTAVATSPAGTYPITCTVGTLAATNYVFVFAPGTLTVNPAPLTVTVANASRAYGDPNPAFTGTISGLKNGDVITATYSTTATQTSPVGTYPITATLVDPGNVLGNYAVTNTPGTLTVTPAALVVTANNAARLYGDPNPAFSGSIAGIKNGDNITATYTTPATPASPVGTYPIIPVLNDPTNKLGNYTVTLNNGSLTITGINLTVNVANATRAFGTPNPVFTGTFIGLRAGDNVTATYSTTATATSPVGTYPITATLADPGNVLGNYFVTINPGTLTVTTQTLTVTAANASRLYGDPNPLFTGVITGIVNGDNITATYASTATPSSPVGTYAIVPTVSDNGTGALVNYTVVINNGILTVSPAPLSVAAANATSVYGDPIPVLTGAIVGIKNGDNITATFATTATPASPVGTYPIVPTLIDPTLKLGNYTVTSINGTLTITAAPLTVTAGNASRLFGTPNPPLSGIIAGIKNGDNITATYATTAVATSPVGTYPITPTLVDPAGALGNYTVTSNNGTLTVNAAPTGNFVFVNNQAVAGNSISGYSVAADGALTSLAGSPVATGGLGGSIACSSVDRITLSAGNNLLFVSNSGDQSISAFSINPASGALTAVAGSPFASGLTLDACGGISLAASPDGRFLMASSNGQIKTFSIGAGGALSPSFTAANPVAPNASMKISANGQYLAVSNGTSVSVFTINGDGSLAAVAGSPFAKAGTGTLAGLDFSSTSGLLYGAEASATAGLADAWTVATGGGLSAVAGSPFSATAINSNAVLLSPDNSLLFASNQGSSNINSFSASAGGSLASIGSFGSLHAPVGMATDRSGSLLYVADDTFGVAVFNIGGAGALSQLSDVAIAGAGQVQSLVAYPPRMASTADVSVAAAAGSPSVVAGQNVTYTLTVTNNGADPASVTVTDTLPSGFTLVSCAATGNSACAGTSSAANFYLLQSGETQTVTLVATAGLSIPDGTVTTNTASISNNSAVDPNAANNSATVTVTVAQPTTSALTVAPATATYGAGTTTLSATLKDSLGAAIPGKTISFTFNAAPAGSAVTDATGTASVPASLAGINAGTYAGAVSASFAGDANTKAASGSANLVVNPAVLTVTAGNATRVYGDPNPTFTFTFSGFVNGETAAVLTGSPSCTTVADPTSAVGTSPITCSAGTLSAANYTFTFVSGTLTITPAPLSVGAANATRVYGDPNPAFTGTLTGIKNADNITATYNSTATAASAVGTYPITPALVDPTGKLGNYTVTSTNGTLTVTPAPLSVTAASTSRAFGDPNPVFTGTITGIKNADNITASYSTTATATSPVGTYPIVPALSDPTLKLSNYTVTSTNGTLTVSPAPLTVTAANASRFYGDANPVFTGAITGIKNGDNITATYASAATATSAPGAYAIVPTLVDPAGALVNYTVVSNNGVLTVNAAPLTVVADSATRAYGTANPVFTGTITGLKNGDAITATYTSATDATSNAGTYPITPVLSDPTNKLSNYAVTLTNGTLTVTPVPLTITAANATRLYGDPNVLSGTITGLLNGDNITATYTSAAATAAVGTYPIVPAAVDPAGKLGNYTVTLNNGTLTVTPAPLSVAAANASRAYGDPNVLSGTITGIKNGDNITATYSTTATATSVPGTYPIVPALVDPTAKLGNYTVTSTNGTLTVTPAVLTVTAANASMVYGDPVPALTGTITGIKNGENITASYSTAATSASPVGTYAIVPTVTDNATGALANYTVVINSGTLTVTPAPLTATAANAAQLYGDASPIFLGAITGLKNGDNITVSFSSPATATSTVGLYPIIPTLSDPTAKLSNYAVTINNGVLTISPAPLTVQAADATRPVNTANPIFTGTITGIKNNDNITATFDSPALQTDPAGTYPIIPTLVDPGGLLVNYTVTSINGTLTVTP